MIPGYFVTIEPDECRRLLGEALVGRVSWESSRSGQLVLPVNFALVDDQVVFTVAKESVLSELSTPTAVAFEVDDLDNSTATGWSVLVQGTTGLYDGDADLRSLPWAPGVRDVTIAITPTAMSGRAVSADED